MDVNTSLVWWIHFLLGLFSWITGVPLYLEQFYVGAHNNNTNANNNNNNNINNNNNNSTLPASNVSFCDNARDSIKNHVLSEGSFQGEIVIPSDGYRFGKARDQYASVTYGHHLTPNVIVLVQSESDVQSAVQFASHCNYSVSIRSGGHSYLGSSSCDSSSSSKDGNNNNNRKKCLQIDVSNLNQRRLLVLPNNSNHQVILGPGNRLSDASEFLKRHGRFLPTGECPGVALGGHMQTGGFGLFTRSFGPFTSRVESFRIVLADGSVHHIQVPTPPPTNETSTTTTTNNNNNNNMNNDLFYAVLGGASGSWGVITEMTVNTIRDEDYFSVYWKLAYWWETPEDTDGIVNMMRTFTQLAEQRKNDWRWGAHWSVVGAKNVPGMGNRIQLEGSWIAPNDQADQYDLELFRSIDDACTRCRRFRYINVTEPLSQIWRYRYIRTRIHNATGREFPVPYTRAMQQFETFPEPDAMERIVRNIAELLPRRTSPHFMISQLTAMRGADSNRALPWPKDVLGITLDYFYIPPTQYLYDYEEISRTFGKHLIANAKGKDHRMYWAAYDNPEIENDWPKYFESQEKYRRLQQIKHRYDPENLFQNKMSIPLPLPECAVNSTTTRADLAKS